MGTLDGTDNHAASILPLPAEVVAQVQSSVTITSLTEVVLELVKNSLDADARRIDVLVDFGRGGCSVEDNGLGIRPSEFREDGRLCKPYCTSKYQNLAPTHGYRGMFLSSLAALSLLTITSHHHLNCSHNTLILHHSKAAARHLPASAQHELSFRDHGTRVTVRDLFGNMPVRVKQRSVVAQEHVEQDRQFEALKTAVMGLVLSWPRQLSVVLRSSSDRNRKVVLRPQDTEQLATNDQCKEINTQRRSSCDLNRTLSILCQGDLIMADCRSSWVPVSASTASVKVKGAISLEPAPTKRVQFISLGVRPIYATSGYSIIYDEMNRIFTQSSFGASQSGPYIDDAEIDRRKLDRRYKSDGYTSKHIKGGRKGLDRWPMFYIRISIIDSKAHTSEAMLTLRDNEDNLKRIVQVVAAMVTQWLAEHHFLPKKKPRKQSVFDPPNTSMACSNHTSVKESRAAAPESTPDDNDERASNYHDGKTKRRVLSSAEARNTPIKAVSAPTQRGAAIRQGFASWSRIKSGRPEFYGDLLDAMKPQRKLSSAPPWQAGNQQVDPKISATSDYHLPKCNGFGETGSFSSELALASRSGEYHALSRSNGNALLREDSLTANASLPDTDAPQKAASEEAVPEDAAPEDALIWTNPITKAKVLVDKRTGTVKLPSFTTKRQPCQDVSAQPNPALRVRSLRMTSATRKPDISDNPDTWLKGFLQDWTNPIYCPTEKPILQASLEEPGLGATDSLQGRQSYRHSQCDIDEAFRTVSALNESKIARSDLKAAEVIRQVDSKYILIKFGTSAPETPSRSRRYPVNDLLVLVDQHAADERCQLEGLLKELCAPTNPADTAFQSELGFAASVKTSKLAEAIRFQVSAYEGNLFARHADHFAKWGILYDLKSADANKPLSEHTKQTITIQTLPPGIEERCRADTTVVVELMRSELWKREERGRTRKDAVYTPNALNVNKAETPSESEAEETHAWVRKIGDCPQGILDLLYSRSCRSAIMFNDVLSLEDCGALITRLADCAFPFQCAHGRPSMAPLVNVGIWSASQSFLGVPAAGPQETLDCYSKAFKRWQEKRGHDTSTELFEQ